MVYNQQNLEYVKFYETNHSLFSINKLGKRQERREKGRERERKEKRRLKSKSFKKNSCLNSDLNKIKNKQVCISHWEKFVYQLDIM